MDSGWFVMVPILLKAPYLPWVRLDLAHMSQKEIHMRYVSGYNDATTKLHVFKITLDTMHLISSEWHQDKQHWIFRAGCVCWQLEKCGICSHKTRVITSKHISEHASPLP